MELILLLIVIFLAYKLAKKLFKPINSDPFRNYDHD